ncbi:MAG: Gfo/Idh/MocA family oxidoreductase [Microcella sp.]|uniref:Gfo/Idh/MocA family protein n=1 Tax=Microcella sp. TaxID=1913979 RepID=UPI00331643A1
MTHESTTGIGVIGTGWWATQFHIPAILSSRGGHLAGIADQNHDRLLAASTAFEPRLATTDHRDLLEDDDVTGVVIATPHSSHFGLAKDALTAGKHVLVEKPLTLHGEEARELQELARAQDRALLVGHTYQHTRHAKRAREVVRSGAIGEVTFVSALFASMVTAYYQGNPDEYRAVFNFPVNGPSPDTYSNPALSGGGQAWTQMTHLMDMVFWVTGLSGDRVFARMENRDLDVDLIDSMSFILSNGAIGTAGSTGQLQAGQGQQQELRYYGTEGYVLQELINGTLTIVLNDGSVEEVPDAGPDEIYPTGGPVQSLIDVCSGGAFGPETADSSIATVEFLEAAYRSSSSGRDERIGSSNA